MANSKIKGNKVQKTKLVNGGKQIVINILRWAYHSTMVVSTLVLLFLYLASAFSDHIDPRRFLYISFLGIGFHILLDIVICWLVALIILRNWKLVTVTAIVLICTWEQITRYSPLNFLETKTDSTIVALNRENGIDTLSLLTYNTCALGQVHLSNIDEKIPILDVIRQSNADIVCLQEYAFTLSKGGHTQQQIRKSLADIYPYYDYMPNYGRQAMGIAFFSKFPIRKMIRIDKSNKNYVSSMYYELDIKGRRIAIVNNHLKSNLIAKRDRILYDEMVEHFATDSIERIRTGMLRSLGKGYVARARQSNLIKKFVQKQIGERDLPTIICGDFNDTPISYCYRTMRGSLQDAWQNAGLGRGSTYNQHHFWFRIDHVLISSHFKTLNIKILDHYKYSDHYPVLTKLQLLPCK